MKCLLLCPPASLNGERIYPRSDVPVTVPYIASLLEENSVETKILDAFVLNLTLNDINKRIEEMKPNIVGIIPFDITRETPIHISHEIASSIKQNNPEIKVGLLWSFDFNYFIQQLKNNPHLDFVVLGDPEVTTVDICKNIWDKKKIRKIRGLAYRKNEKIIVNEERELSNMDALKYPAWHLLNIDDYEVIPHIHMSRSFICLLTSRGCPYNCKFCFPQFESKEYRTKSVKSLVNEIKYVICRYKVNEIRFEGRIFAVDRKWIVNFCDELIKENLNIKWSCLMRVDLVEKDILMKMRKAGCWNIEYGIETGCKDLLKIIDKRITLSQAKNAVRWTQEAGIEATASFLLGLPGETPELGMKTIEFAKELNLDYAQFFLTRFYEEPKKFQKYGKISDWYNPRYGYKGPIFIPSKYKDIYELIKMERLAYRKFYLRKSFIIRKLLKIRTVNDVKRYFQGLKILFRM